MSLSSQLLPTLLVVCSTALFHGCGVQGTPHPPRIEIPTKVTNLSAQQLGQKVEIKFTLPEVANDGQRLTNPLEIEILLAAIPPSSGLSKLPEGTVWKRLVRDEWLPHTYGASVLYSAPMTAQEFTNWRGQTLAIGVRTLTRGFRRRPLESAVSNIVDVPIYDVTGPVENFKVATTEKAINIQFSAPATSLGGAPVHDLEGFRIARSPTGSPGSFETLADVPTPGYRDTNFEFGQTYYYQVRAEFGVPGHLAMSDPTPAVQITPRDTFPPGAPEGLSSIYSASGVELVWTANSEPDLAGYNVYRLENQHEQRVNKGLVQTPIFRDTAATPGTTLTYYVTAVDASGNESRPSKHEDVETK